MSTNIRSCWIGLPLLTLLAAGAAVQPLTETQPAGLSYASPLSGYRKWDDQQVNSWRDANDRVGRVGGWRAYSREAQAVSVPAQLNGTPSALPTGGQHGQHNSHHNPHHMGEKP